MICCLFLADKWTYGKFLFLFFEGGGGWGWEGAAPEVGEHDRVLRGGG